MRTKNTEEFLTTHFAGVSRSFLEGLRPLSSKAAQLLLLPLALEVEFTKKHNDLEFAVPKKDILEIFQLPKSYKEEGHINAYIDNILRTELLDLEVDGIPILNPAGICLSRGWFEISFTQDAMDTFFQGLSSGYFTISLDTIAKMKNKNTWNIVKALFLDFDFRSGSTKTFARHTKKLKTILGYSKEDYTSAATGSFQRTRFEERCLHPAAKDILSMQQFSIYPAWGASPEKPLYWGKTYLDGGYTGLVDNYTFLYKINKFDFKALKKDDDTEDFPTESILKEVFA